MPNKKSLKSATGYPVLQEFNKINQKVTDSSENMLALGAEIEKSLIFQQLSTDIFKSIINPHSDLPITSKHVLNKTINVLNLEAGMIHIFDEDSGKFLLMASNSILKDFSDENKKVSFGEGFIGLAGKNLTEPLVVNYNGIGNDKIPNQFKNICMKLFKASKPTESPEDIVLVPIRFKEGIVGVLTLVTEKGRGFSDGDFELINILSSYLALGLKNNMLFEETRRQATRDTLTDLHNRLYFQEFLDLELNRSKRYGKPLSVAMMDIDFFKKINDSFGHDVGDTILKEFADILKKSFRKTDLIARYGGEEFIAVLPEADTKNVLKVVSKLKKRISAHYFKSSGQDHQITVSMGVSAFAPDQVISQNELISRADKALYHSKENGRNIISVWADEENNSSLEESSKEKDIIHVNLTE